MTEAVLDRPETPTERMQCMEVWGGNCGINKAFEMPGLQTWVYSRPYGDSHVGGDVYYLSSCASGRISRMLLADVSGHGLEVSELAKGLRDLMRKNVNVVRQTRFVEGMNRQFSRLSEQGSFATALVATFFQPARRLSICNAGHPYPLLFDVAKKSWSILHEDESAGSGITNLPLGLHDQTVYEQTERKLRAGDMVLFYSDALTESRGSQGRLLGTEGLRRVVAELNADSPAELLAELLTTIDSSHADNAGQDDWTVMLCRATGTATTLRDNLLAPFRLFRSVCDSTTLRS